MEEEKEREKRFRALIGGMSEFYRNLAQIHTNIDMLAVEVRRNFPPRTTDDMMNLFAYFSMLKQFYFNISGILESKKKEWYEIMFSRVEANLDLENFGVRDVKTVIKTLEEINKKLYEECWNKRMFVPTMEIMDWVTKAKEAI